MTFYKHILDKFNKSLFKSFLQKKAVNYVIILFLFFIIIFTSMVTTLVPEKFDLKIGQEVSVDIKAPRDVENKIATMNRIKKAVESVEPREKVDPTLQIDIKKKVEKFFSKVYQIKENQGISSEEKIEQLKKYNDLNLNDEQLIVMLNASNKELENIESYIYEIITQVMSSGIKEEELEKEKKNITNYFMGLQEFSGEIRSLGSTIVNLSIRPNRFLDVETTQQKIEEAKKEVEKVIIKRGSILVHRGDILTREQLQILEDAGMTKENGKKDYSLYLGIAILVLLVEALLVAYMYVFNRNLFASLPKLYLIFIIFLSVYIISKIISSFSPFIAPVAIAAMLIGILIDSRLAIAVNLVMAILLTLTNGNNTNFFITMLIGGTVGAFSVIHTQQRGNIFFYGGLVSLSNMIVLLGLELMNNYELSKMLMESFYGIINGVFCAVLTIGSLPLWESLFDILTPLKLLELSNPNHPILKKLLVDAPGTYHHSIIVGNLSEAAADAIGANSLLARVGSYYHDIGKLKRPYFFKENQLTFENPHDKINASLSALIITNHIKDGIEIAKTYKIPQEIMDIIEQHHGTTLVKYFYHKAMNESNEQKTIDEETYRYHGVKPQSREAAIVMLADSVEAAVRSMAEPNAEKMKRLIAKIVEDKFEDRQLDECDLTLKDLDRIKASFNTVLIGIFHERIEYPELNTKRIEVKK